MVPSNTLCVSGGWGCACVQAVGDVCFEYDSASSVIDAYASHSRKNSARYASVADVTLDVASTKVLIFFFLDELGDDITVQQRLCRVIISTSSAAAIHPLAGTFVGRIVRDAAWRASHRGTCWRNGPVWEHGGKV